MKIVKYKIWWLECFDRLSTSGLAFIFKKPLILSLSKVMGGLLLCAFVAYAGHDQEQFLQANKLYAERNFAQAFDTYSALRAKDGAVWENMGNCAYYRQEYPQALLYWYRAQAGAGYHRFNLLAEKIKTVSHSLGVDAESWSEGLFLSVIALTHGAPLALWQLLAILGWCLLLVALSLVSQKKRAQAVTALCLAVFAGSFYGMRYQYGRASFGIVMQENSLHTGMNEALPVVTELKSGQKVKIVDKAAEWYHVSTAQHAGWTHKKNIEVVEVQC